MGLEAAMHIVRCKNGKADPQVHMFSLTPGKGHLITTYSGGNEEPLAPFSAENPLEVTIGYADSEPIAIAQGIYDAIYGGAKPGDNFRVATAAMVRDRDTNKIGTFVINRSHRDS